MSIYRLFTTITGIFITGFLFAQNVGIGTATPVEKLDVTGNINVSGTIKANGVDGQPNQVFRESGVRSQEPAMIIGKKNGLR